LARFLHFPQDALFRSRCVSPDLYSPSPRTHCPPLAPSECMRPTTCPRHSPCWTPSGHSEAQRRCCICDGGGGRVLSTSDTSSRICALAVGSRYGAVATEQMRMDVVCRSVDGTVRHGVEVVQAGCTAVRASTLQHDRPHSSSTLGGCVKSMNVWRVVRHGRCPFVSDNIGKNHTVLRGGPY
jgi:hypothetical protein